MKTAYHLTYEHQYQGQDYGLFEYLEKAEKYLEDYLKVDINKVVDYYQGQIRIYGDYRIERKGLK